MVFLDKKNFGILKTIINEILVSLSRCHYNISATTQWKAHVL